VGTLDVAGLLGSSTCTPPRCSRRTKLSKDQMHRLRHFIVDLKFPPIEEAEVTQKVQI